MKRFTFLFMILLMIAGCRGPKTRDADLSGIECPPVRIKRYDLDLFNANTPDLKANLKKLLPEYRLFLGDSTDDPAKLSVLKQYLDDPRNQDFIRAVRKAYPSLEDIEKDMTLAFRRFRYFFPSFRYPLVFAYISGGDYEYPVQFSDSVLLIGFDNYLGKDYAPYKADGVSVYQTERMDRRHVVPDCVRLLANSLYPVETGGNSLLDVMVEAGKRLYVQDLVIPDVPDGIKIGYTDNQMEWIRKNEFQVWAAIIENHMLYSNDGRIIRVFSSDGPFTAEFSKVSPPLLGNWIGWQIVRHYMQKNPEVTVEQLLREKDAQKILSGSRYKPEK